MSYFSMIFSQCAPGRLYSAAIWHAEIFFFPSHQSLRNKLYSIRHKDYQETFPLFIFSRYLIKKSQSHDFWPSNSNLSEMISRGTLMTRSPPTSLSAWLPPGMDRKPLGNAVHKLAQYSHWPPSWSDCLQLAGISGICVCPLSGCAHWCSRLGFAISRSGLPTYLAECWPLLLAYQQCSLGC